MKQISYGQLLTLLFISRIFKTMTYNPFRDAQPFTIMICIAISVAIQALLVIPVILIYKKNKGEDIISLAFSKGKILGILLTFVYGLYFIVISLSTVKYFSLFMSSMFPVINSDKIIAVILVIIAVYGAFQGIEAIGRSASIVFALFFAMMLLIGLTEQGNIDLYNFSLVPPEKEKSFFEFLIYELGTNFELIAITVLLPKIKSSLTKGVYLFLAIKLIVIEFSIFLSVTILGEYIKMTELPFFEVGAFSKTQFIERFDAIYMLVWTFCAVICLGLFLYLASTCFENVLKKTGEKKLSLFIGSGVLAITIIFRIQETTVDVWYSQWLSCILVVLLLTILPLYLFLSSRNKNEKNQKGYRKELS